jgi:hypothetical protein
VKDVDTPVPVLFLHGHRVHASGLDADFVCSWLKEHV